MVILTITRTATAIRTGTSTNKPQALFALSLSACETLVKGLRTGLKSGA